MTRNNSITEGGPQWSQNPGHYSSREDNANGVPPLSLDVTLPNTTGARLWSGLEDVLRSGEAEFCLHGPQKAF